MAQPKRKQKDKKTPESAPEQSSPTGSAEPTASTEPAKPEAGAPAEPWKKPAGLTRRGWAILAGVVVLANFPVIHYDLLRSRPEAPVALPYSDDFSSPERLTRNYWNSGGQWRLLNGELLSPGVRNNPLWLQAKLPQDVAVEFDVRSMSPEGDIKVEIFGNGTDHASGYILIHGGWSNSISVIARLDEHGRSLSSLETEARKIAAEGKLPSSSVVDTGVFRKSTRMRVEANPYPVQPGKTYHWRIERRGSLLSWYIDGKHFMSFDDPFPLTGPDHDRFGFSSWEADLYFDNLKITPL